MTETAATQRRRQVLTGKVVSSKNDKTITVTVETTVMHRLYQRYMKRTHRFAVHDEQNTCQVGDMVTIIACRPLSKNKRWRLGKILRSAGGQA
jgi:small subunit ribosomal protein S17